MKSLFVPLDVNFTDDPKVLRAGPDAELVYVRSCLLAKRLGGNGRIERIHLFRLAGDLTAVRCGETSEVEIASALVREGLWAEVDDDWVIAAWLNHNPSDSEIEESRQAERDRKATWRRSRQDTTQRDEVSHGTESLATRSREKKETESQRTQRTDLAPAVRARDPIWDAIVDCWQIDQAELTTTERSRLNKVCKLLRDVPADPSEVPRRRLVYRRKYPDAADTPMAVAGRWAELAREPPADVPKSLGAVHALAREVIDA